jgi:hypothetical protein
MAVVQQKAPAVMAVSVRLRSRVEKVKKPSPLKAAATSTMMKVANQISIAKTQTVKPWPQAGQTVLVVIVPTVEAEIVEAVVAGIAEVVDVAREAAVIVVLVAAVIAATAK